MLYIVYYIGGGTFGGEIHLQVINLKFENHIALAVLAWVLPVWFWIKFNQRKPLNIYAIIENNSSSVVALKNDKWLSKYLKLRTGYKAKGTSGQGKKIRVDNVFTRIDKLDANKRKWFLQVSYWDWDGERGHHVGSQTSPSEDLEITRAWGGLVPVFLTASLTIKAKEIAENIVPNILFWAAVALGVVNTGFPFLGEWLEYGFQLVVDRFAN